MANIQEMLREACEDSGEVSFRNDYSGRGMYGRQCVGIVATHSECMAVIGSVIKSLSMTITARALEVNAMGTTTSLDDVANEENFFDQGVDMLLDFSQDNMGMSGVVLYWPELASIPAEVSEVDDFGNLDQDH